MSESDPPRAPTTEALAAAAAERMRGRMMCGARSASRRLVSACWPSRRAAPDCVAAVAKGARYDDVVATASFSVELIRGLEEAWPPVGEDAAGAGREGGGAWRRPAEERSCSSSHAAYMAMVHRPGEMWAEDEDAAEDAAKDGDEDGDGDRDGDEGEGAGAGGAQSA